MHVKLITNLLFCANMYVDLQSGNVGKVCSPRFVCMKQTKPLTPYTRMSVIVRLFFSD